MEGNFMKKAFDIGDIPENFDLNVAPVTGIDYLHHVRIETRRCPKVVVSDIDTTKFLSRQTISVDGGNGFVLARPGFEPDPEWREEQLQSFSDYRLKMSENRDHLKQKFPRKDVPRINKKQEWCLFCLGVEKHDLIYGKEEEPEVSNDNSTAANPKKALFRDSPNPPLLSIILYMNQSRVAKILSYHIDWLEETGFSHHQGEWLYALLVALEKPLDPDTCALLRSLSRECSKLRNEISTSDHEFVRALNLLLSIVAHYFDQKDMSDEFFTTQ